jgi:hypothetical protein
MSALRYLLPLLLVSPSPIAAAQRFTRVAATQLPKADSLLLVPQTPDGTWRTVFDQLIVTSVSSGLIGVTLYHVVGNPESAQTRGASNEPFKPNANTAYVAGAYVAATVVVLWSGRAHGHDGTWIGSALGGAVIALPMLIVARRTTLFLPMSAYIWAPLQAIVSTTGFQLSRRNR